MIFRISLPNKKSQSYRQVRSRIAADEKKSFGIGFDVFDHKVTPAARSLSAEIQIFVHRVLHTAMFVFMLGHSGEGAEISEQFGIVCWIFLIFCPKVRLVADSLPSELPKSAVAPARTRFAI